MGFRLSGVQSAGDRSIQGTTPVLHATARWGVQEAPGVAYLVVACVGLAMICWSWFRFDSLDALYRPERHKLIAHIREAGIGVEAAALVLCVVAISRGRRRYGDLFWVALTISGITLGIVLAVFLYCIVFMGTM